VRTNIGKYSLFINVQQFTRNMLLVCCIEKQLTHYRETCISMSLLSSSTQPDINRKVKIETKDV